MELPRYKDEGRHKERDREKMRQRERVRERVSASGRNAHKRSKAPHSRQTLLDKCFQHVFTDLPQAKTKKIIKKTVAINQGGNLS